MQVELEAVSSSLFSGMDITKPVPRKYDIGMNEYVDDAAFEETRRSVLGLGWV